MGCSVRTLAGLIDRVVRLKRSAWHLWQWTWPIAEGVNGFGAAVDEYAHCLRVFRLFDTELRKVSYRGTDTVALASKAYDAGGGFVSTVIWSALTGAEGRVYKGMSRG